MKMEMLLIRCLAIIVVLSSVHALRSTRLNGCRSIHRSRNDQRLNEAYPAVLEQYNNYTCSRIDASKTANARNYTEARNECYNYITCEDGHCRQCPCPANETFNPVTLKCDRDQAVCRCPGTGSTKTAVPVAQTPSPTVTQDTISITEHVLKNEVTTEAGMMYNQTVTIVAIVAGTTLVLVLLIVAFVVWQLRRHINHSVQPKSIPSSGSSSSSGCSNRDTDYLDINSTHEYHVYAEIDDPNRQTPPTSRLVPRNPQSTIIPPVTSPLMSSIPLLAPPSPPKRHESQATAGYEPIRAYHRLQSYETPSSISECSTPCNGLPSHHSAGSLYQGTAQDNSYSSTSVIDCKACREWSSHRCMKLNNNSSMRGNGNNALPVEQNYDDAIYRPWMATPASQA